MAMIILIKFHQSAAMAGLKVVAVKVHPDGNLDLEDLRGKAEKYRDNLAAFMVGSDRGKVDSFVDNH